MQRGFVQYFLAATLILACQTAVKGADTSFADLKITEVVNSVSVVEPASKKARQARQSDIFPASNILITGQSSRAELVAGDGTVARVGSNTTFTASPDRREVSINRGSVMFHSPKGRGGGLIKSPGASAAVIGTSLIVSATQNGGFKLLVLEGKAQATLPGGAASTLSAGQMTFILPGSRSFGPVISFRLKDQVGGSALIKGFKNTLPSLEKITASITAQEKKITSGKASATDILITDTQAFSVQQIDPSLVQTRIAIASSAKKSSAMTFDDALASSVSVSGGALAPERIFKFSNASIPAAALAILGPEAASNIGYYPEGSHAFFAGKDISILGDRGSFSLGSFSSAEGHVFLAKENFTIDEGLSASNSNIVNARTSMDSLLSAPAQPENGVWVAVGKSITIKNSLLRENIPYLTLGNWYDAYPNISVELKDSAILGALQYTTTGPYPYTSYSDFYAGGTTVSATNTNIIVTGNIQIKGGQIDVTSDSTAVRELTAGYNSSYGTAANSGSRINMKAQGDLNITETNLGAAIINLDARTINLIGVDFKSGANVTLTSGMQGLAPNPNTNAPSVPRMVNFIRNVTYGGSPAQNFVDPSLGGSASTPSQIKINLMANGR